MVYSEYQSWRACVAGENADIDRIRTIKDKAPGLRLNHQLPAAAPFSAAHDCVAPEIELCKTLCINTTTTKRAPPPAPRDRAPP